MLFKSKSLMSLGGIIASLSLLFFFSLQIAFCNGNGLPVYAPPDLIYDTQNGQIRCTTEKEGTVVACLGIPYAASPTGANRFRVAQPAPNWSGILDATQFGQPCVQPNNSKSIPADGEANAVGSEDCLFLNLWKMGRGGTKCDIEFVLPGGGQNEGSGGTSPPLDDAIIVQALNQGQDFVQRQGQDFVDKQQRIDDKCVIFISINYRDGLMGFLSLPELSARNFNDTGKNESGTWGTSDQIMGLQWVQNNVHYFEGDPDQVGIKGDSGGATAAQTLVGSPLAEGLFSSAFIISSLGDHMPTQATAIANYEELFAGRLNCTGYPDRLTCLLEKDAYAIYRETEQDVLFVPFNAGGVVGFPDNLGTPGAPIGTSYQPHTTAYALEHTDINKNVKLTFVTMQSEQSYISLQVVFNDAPPPTRADCAYFAYRYAFDVTGRNASDPAIITWVEDGLDMYASDVFKGIDYGIIQCISHVNYGTSNERNVRAAARGGRKPRKAVWSHIDSQLAPLWAYFGIRPLTEHGMSDYYFNGDFNYSPIFAVGQYNDFEVWLSETYQQCARLNAMGKDVAGWHPYDIVNQWYLSVNDSLVMAKRYESTFYDHWLNPPTF